MSWRWLSLVLVACLLACASPAGAAVTVIDTQIGTIIDSSITLGINCTGANFMLIQISANAAGAYPILTGTYNGVDFLATPVANSGPVDALGNDNNVYKLASPSTGMNNIVVTTSNAGVRVWVGAVCLAGVNTSTPLGTPVTTPGVGAVSSETTTPTSVAGDFVIDFLLSSNTSGFDSKDASQVLRWQPIDGGTGVEASSKTATGTTTPMTWTAGGGLANMSVVSVAVKPAGMPSSLVPISVGGKVQFGGKTSGQ
jgi:hypothetical protein